MRSSPPPPGIPDAAGSAPRTHKDNCSPDCDSSSPPVWDPVVELNLLQCVDRKRRGEIEGVAFGPHEETHFWGALINALKLIS